jgi:2-dehydro-3-deoxyphosphogalactonate aldolase
MHGRKHMCGRRSAEIGIDGMTLDAILDAGAPPIVAILRGVRPTEVLSIAGALVDAGIRIIEVPLNSPDPFESIRALQQAFGHEVMIGAGTVLDVAAVAALAATGARIMVTPNTDPHVIARAVECGLEPMPGFFTPSEAFRAVAAGARRLKLFPAAAMGPSYLKAIWEVLPETVKPWAVGGTGAANIGDWLKAGAEGIGVGGALYRAGDAVDRVAEQAQQLIATWRSCRRDLR